MIIVMKNLKMIVWFVMFAALQGATICALILIRGQWWMMNGMWMMPMANQWLITFLVVFLWGMFTMKSMKMCCGSKMDNCGTMGMDKPMAKKM